ncbi:WD domain, G-beta repeat domain-containing protein [Hirsutella rhossiliensis]|uniref:WD domain, g-beta repeat domain-containing protein n=1 Tax=Hirsutella rhossiliensis TaxID=111463 RepID=A0A9P8MU35_9HYPO|nr:WD domain, g-beta repeat domain-containing protein [Hirsutella rhossiliensis]KAH0961427.1 WD domain, g-beta repeat domain-containing protein [Hirsutella rhossiliensis]
MATQLSPPAILGDGPFTSNRDSKAAPIPAAAQLAGPSDAPEHHFNGQSQPLTRRSTTLLSRSNTSQNVKEKDPGRGITRALTTATTSANPCLDPLSTQIYLRTNSNGNIESTIAQRLRNPTRPESPTSDQVHDPSTKSANGAADASRERKKGPSFLSRLGMRGARKRDDDMPDSDSDLGDRRTDGSNARAMTSVAGAGGGYIPLYKEPPRYIRVKRHNKKGRDFNRLFLAQELLGTKPPSDDEPLPSRAPATAVGNKILKAGDAIWAAEFSLDGRYLAVAGKDQTVRVFSVISTPEERRAHEEEEEKQNRGNGEKLSAPVFRSKPTSEFEGHTGEVLALSWSKNNFLLSSSMDKTVRLWHVSRAECLCVFQHDDLVTSIAFHPTDDRFFLAGSLDAQLRLWSIPDNSVAFSAQANEFITAVAFSPDGKTAICGVLSGLCTFFETEGLKQQFQIHVRSSRGKNAKGSKITGIRTVKMPAEAESGDVKVLISSNDSRVRIYSLKTRMLEVKFKGLVNQSSQIHARFSDDGMYVVSGSEDRRAYMWGTGHPEAELKDKQPYECFDAHPEVVTTALMAPVKSRQLLSASGDPIYDLCNPPPVMLLSLDEKTASQTKFSDDGHADAPPGVKRPEESPAYIERSKHLDGNILVTTDKSGTIKVFRQDCAYAKRQQNTWETGSIFSGKLTGIGRSSSIVTKTSGGSRVHSRRGSLTGPVQVQLASDRIMSWRQDMEGRASTSGTAARSERSMSPMKSNRAPLNTSAANLASEARKQPYASSPVTRAHNASSPTSSIQTSKTSLKLPKDKEQGPTVPPTPSFSLLSVSDSDHQELKGEGGFWNLSRWKVLKYPTNAAAPAPMGKESSSSDHSKTKSEGVVAEGKPPGRRSMVLSEHRKSKLGDDGGRPKSVDPAQPSKSRASESDAKAVRGSDRPKTRDGPYSSNRRMNSGVA